MPFRLVSLVGLDGDRVPMRCKSWRCPDCGPWLRRRLRKEIIKEAEVWKLYRFFTATLPGNTRQLSLKDQYREQYKIHRRFAKLRARNDCKRAGSHPARAKRNTAHLRPVHHCKPWNYVRVTEAHKNGTPHLHGLMPAFVPIMEFRRDWVQAGGGENVNLQLVDVHRVGAYLSKYLVKDDLPLEKRMRKYAAGGECSLRGVRPKSKKGTHRIEFWGKRIGRQDGWEPVSDPRPLLGYLQKRPDPPDALRAAIVAFQTRREMQAIADSLVVCVVCGGDHERHPVR